MKLNLFSDLKDACVDLIKILPCLNDAQRKDIRDILLQLKGDLSDSLVLAEQYLNGVLRSTRDTDILQQMCDAPERLRQAYNEFKICAALYHLHDRFNQWFSSVKGAVDVKHVGAIRSLIGRVADGERFVMNELQDVLRKLPVFAQQYESGNATERAAVIQNAHRYIKDALATLRRAETDTKKAINAVIALM